MTLRTGVFVGDSLTEGSTNSARLGLGGTGTWVQLLRTQLGSISGLGPIVSSGLIYCGVNVAGGTSKWSFSGTWTDTTVGDAWDIGWHGNSGGNATLRYGNGSTKIATFTYSNDIQYPNVGFTLYCVDYTNGGNWSYSVDGGTNWIASGVTTTSNKITKIYVATPLSLNSTVKVRCANAAGTGVGCAPFGIEVFYQTPSTASGLIIHECAVFGAALRNLMGGGNRAAFLKPSMMNLGSGTISHIPNIFTILMHVNDMAGPSNGGWTDVTTYGQDITDFHAIASKVGPVGFINPYEVTNDTYLLANQIAFRAKMKSVAASLLPYANVLDLYDRFNAKGRGPVANMASAGYLGGDDIHETAAGHAAIEPYIYEWIMNNFLQGLTDQPSYSIKGTYTKGAAVSSGQVTKAVSARNVVPSVPGLIV